MTGRNRDTSKHVSKQSRNAGRHRNKTQEIELLVTDADGTMWSFWDYFVPAMRFVLPTLADKLGVDKDVFAKEVGRVMSEKGTHEYPWVLEHTCYAREFKGSRQEFANEFTVPFWAALDKYRAKYLELFHDVRETLETVNKLRKKVKVAILSDAPYHMALTRPTQLGVTHLFSAVYALDTPEPMLSSLADPFDIEHGRMRVNNFLHANHRFDSACCMPNDYEKPDRRGLAKIISDFGVHPSRVLYIGDSLAKDGVVAEKLGVNFIWARYGINMPAEYRAMIGHVLNPSASPITNGHNTTYIPKNLPPMVAEAASFAEVLNHLTVEAKPKKRKHLPLATQKALPRTPGH